MLNKHLNKYAKVNNSSAQSVSDINHISSLYIQDFIVATLYIILLTESYFKKVIEKIFILEEHI